MTSFGDELVEGFNELADALESGQKISKSFNYNKRVLSLKPAEHYTPELVKETREDVMRVSQAIFAEFFGVSVKTVQAWEQGRNPVTGTACRLLDAIRAHPDYWENLLKDLVLVDS